MKNKYGRITKDIQTAEGMLHKNTKVFVQDIRCKCTHGESNIQVEDNAGRIFWIGNNDILVS